MRALPLPAGSLPLDARLRRCRFLRDHFALDAVAPLPLAAGSLPPDADAPLPLPAGSLPLDAVAPLPLPAGSLPLDAVAPLPLPAGSLALDARCAVAASCGIASTRRGCAVAASCGITCRRGRRNLLCRGRLIGSARGRTRRRSCHDRSGDMPLSRSKQLGAATSTCRKRDLRSSRAGRLTCTDEHLCRTLPLTDTRPRRRRLVCRSPRGRRSGDYYTPGPRCQI